MTGQNNFIVLEKMEKRRSLKEIYYQKLCKSIRPVIIFSRIVGFLPRATPTSEKKKSGKLILKMITTDWIYFTIYLTSYLLVLLYNLKILVNKEIVFYISKNLQIVFVSISGLYTFGLITFAYKERDVLNACLNCISEVDNLLEMIELEICYGNLQKKILLNFFIISLLTAIRTLSFLLVREIYFMQHICLFFTLILKLAFVSIFCIFADILSYRFALINDTIKSYARHRNDIHTTSLYIEKLYILCRSHFKLCNVALKLTSSYGFQLLFMAIVMMLNFVSQFYLLYVFWNLNNASGGIVKLVAISFWFLTETYEIYGLVLKCTQASGNANEVPITLHELQNEVDNYKIEEEIQKYSLKMLHQRLGFSALEFFEFDFSLLFTMMGSILTFLVIVVQIEQGNMKDVAYTVTELINSTLTTVMDDIVDGDYDDYDY